MSEEANKSETLDLKGIKLHSGLLEDFIRIYCHLEWASSLAVRALATCCEDHGSRPT